MDAIQLILKALHVCSAIIWVGGSFILVVNAALADRRGVEQELAHINADLVRLAAKVLGPATILTGIFGILTFARSDWTLGDAWIQIGLAGFAITTIVGLGIIVPTSKRLRMESQRADADLNRLRDTRYNLRTIGRADVFLLFIVVLAMVTKPSASDTGLLMVLSSLLLLDIAYFFRRIWSRRRA